VKFLARRTIFWGGLVLLLGLAVIEGTGPNPPVLEPAAQAQPTITEGIDVSHYQGSINWAAVRNAGKRFGFVKASEGTTYQDPFFRTNWQNMGYNRVVRGAYHFGHPELDPYAQVDNFVSVAHPKTGDLQLTLDLEITGGKSPREIFHWTRAFISYLHARTGRPGIIYTGFYFWRDSVGNPPYNLNCPLWLAAYVPNPNSYVPSAWSTWSFWQYSDTGHVPGISGNVDLDYWNGGLPNLRNLCLP
jgi:GH25 family lysozyme M1 (1,4-beta-N-acetylmuramidase)